MGRRRPEGRLAAAGARDGRRPSLECRDGRLPGPARRALGRHRPRALLPDARPPDPCLRFAFGPARLVHLLGRRGPRGIRLGRHEPRRRPDRPVGRGPGLHDERRPRLERVQRGWLLRRQPGASLDHDGRSVPVPGDPGPATTGVSSRRRLGDPSGQEAAPSRGEPSPAVPSRAADDPIRRPVVPRRGGDDVPLPAGRAFGLVDAGRTGAGGNDLRGPRGGGVRLRGDGDDGRRPLLRRAGVGEGDRGNAVVAPVSRPRRGARRHRVRGGARRQGPGAAARGGAQAARGDRRRADRRAAPAERTAFRARHHRRPDGPPEPPVDPLLGRRGVLARPPARLCRSRWR